METNNEDRIHLENMANSINEVQGYVKGMDYETFRKEDETKAAVYRNLSEIGQAAQLLSDNVQNHFGDMDFKSLITLGNAGYDEYLETSDQMVFNIIKNDLDIIKENLMNASVTLEDDSTEA